MNMKRIFSVLLTLALLITLVSCGKPKPAPDVYETLNGLFASAAGDMDLETAVTVSDRTLRGRYRAERGEDGTYTLTYYYEKLTVFAEDGGTFVLPDSAVETVSGTLTVKDGTVTENGAPVDGAVPAADLSGLHFKRSDFTDVSVESGHFRASVVHPSDFFGASIDAKNMAIDIEYGTSILYSMKITYEKSGAAVELSYLFS